MAQSFQRCIRTSLVLSPIPVILVVVSLGAGTGGAVPEQQPETRPSLQFDSAGTGQVGGLGGPAALTINAGKSVGAEEVRTALFHDVRVQMDSAPSSDLDNYLRSLKSASLAAYLHAGFLAPRIEVAAVPASGHVLMRVTEGARSWQGAVAVAGAKNIPVAKLVAKLTAPDPAGTFVGKVDPTDGSVAIELNSEPFAAPEPAWDQGQPASFDVGALTDLQTAVRRCLAELGFFRARFHVDIVPDGNGDKANLAISITDEGPPATLESVDVVGCIRNRPDEVADYLGLRPGAPIDVTVLEAAQLRLWDSARFIKHVMTAAPSPADASKLRLRIDLEECDSAPPLSGRFSPAEEATVKFRQWMMGLETSGDDLTVDLQAAGTATADPYEVTVVLGFARGAAMRYVRPAPAPATRPASGPTPPTTVPAANRIDLGMVLKPQATGFYDAVTGRRLVTGRVAEPTIVYTYVPTLEPDGKYRSKSSMNAAMNIVPSRADLPGGSNSQPARWHMTLAPVSMIEFAHDKRFTYDVSDGIATMKGSDGTLVRVDTVTGRPLELKYLTEFGDTYRIRTEQGLVAGQEAVLQAAVPGPDRSDPAQQMHSIVDFISDELSHYYGSLAEHSGHDTDWGPATTAVVARTVYASSADPLARLWRNWFVGEGKLIVPSDPLLHPNLSSEYQSVLGSALSSCDELFLRGSWPWTLSRQMLLALAGDTQQAEAEFQRLLTAGRAGPIGCLICAEMLASPDPGAARASRAFAQEGLRRLGTDQLDSDCAVLFGGTGTCSQWLLALAGNLRELSVTEADDAAAALPAGLRKWFIAAAAYLRSTGNQPIDQAMPGLMSRLWENGLRDAAAAELKRLAGPAQ